MRFEAQVMPHLDAAYRFARWLARSSADADDIVQEAVLRAYRGFDGLRASDIKGWLLTIVRNCHATAYRQAQRRATEALPEEGDAQHGYAMVSSEPDPESATILKDDERTFELLMARLSEEHREVLCAAGTGRDELSGDCDGDPPADRHGHVAPGACARRAQGTVADAGARRTQWRALNHCACRPTSTVSWMH